MNLFLKKEINRDFNKVIYKQAKISLPKLRDSLKREHAKDEYETTEAQSNSKSTSEPSKNYVEILIEKKRMEELKSVAKSNDMQSLHSDNDIKISNIEKTMDQLKKSSAILEKSLSVQLENIMEQIKEMKKLMEK